MGEQLAAFAEDAAEDARDGENELAVRNRMADGGGDPFAGGTDAALVARGTEMPGFAGEGEEFFVPAIGALEAGEAGGEVAAAEERFDGGGGSGVERAVGWPVIVLVVGEEFVPSVVDELPEGRGAGSAWLVDDGHIIVQKNNYEQPQGKLSVVRI